MSYPIVEPVLYEIMAERQRQDEKWGEQNHDAPLYMAILMEEVGEAAQAALPVALGGKSEDELRAELVQVAAVAIAFIESIDRRVTLRSVETVWAKA